MYTIENKTAEMYWNVDYKQYQLAILKWCKFIRSDCHSQQVQLISIWICYCKAQLHYSNHFCFRLTHYLHSIITRITQNVSELVIRSKIYTSYYQCVAPYTVFERKNMLTWISPLCTVMDKSESIWTERFIRKMSVYKQTKYWNNVECQLDATR